MKKFLPIVSVFIMAVIAPSVFAASLDVSKNANFSSEDLNFSGGDRVYVRVVSDGSGSGQKILNIRDNAYNIVSSVDLSKSGNIYSTSFKAPNNQGYFSLEAVIEGDGESSKSVKTIKVGSPGSANVKVNVNSSVKGEKSQSQSPLQGKQSEDLTNKEDNKVDVSPTPEVFTSDSNFTETEKPKKNFWLFTFFGNIFSFFWPFK